MRSMFLFCAASAAVLSSTPALAGTEHPDLASWQTAMGASASVSDWTSLSEGASADGVSFTGYQLNLVAGASLTYESAVGLIMSANGSDLTTMSIALTTEAYGIGLEATSVFADLTAEGYYAGTLVDSVLLTNPGSEAVTQFSGLVFDSLVDEIRIVSASNGDGVIFTAMYFDDDSDLDGYTESGGDCDDATDTVYPGGTELDDGLDNDCDSTVDESISNSATDDDGDLWTEDDGDCNDDDPNVHPNNEEECNGIDDDCLFGIDDGYPDSDGDGYADCLEEDSDNDGYTEDDCAPTDASINPGASEVDNDIDDDCDGIADNHLDSYDDDADGYTENEGDCNDADDQVHEGIDEDNNINYSRDGVDNDCDGEVDEYRSGEDTGEIDEDSDELILVPGGCNSDDALKGGSSCSTSGLCTQLYGIIIGLLALYRRRR